MLTTVYLSSTQACEVSRILENSKKDTNVYWSWHING